jgi:hypothetical protein
VNKELQFILDTLFNGLKRLEYRGYDSAGIALELADAIALISLDSGSLGGAQPIPEENGSQSCMLPLVCKEVGKVRNWAAQHARAAAAASLPACHARRCVWSAAKLNRPMELDGRVVVSPRCAACALILRAEHNLMLLQLILYELHAALRGVAA